MKKDNYDLVILTNCPSFYKVNMYNEISKSISLYVLFLGFSDQVVIDSEFKKSCNFDFDIIYNGQVEKRNIFSSFMTIHSNLSKIKYKKIIYGGYIYIEFILISFLNSKRINILETESAAETALSGWKFRLKVFLLKRYSKVIASGKVHAEMIRKMKFDGPIEITYGVGIIKKLTERFLDNRIQNNPLKFLYVGRLIELKNVEFIIHEFNKNGLPLTIVGDGILRNKLESLSNQNITFLGFKSNETLSEIYKMHDVFILPSLQEPWGLVVEEALYWGCTLLLSKNVGSVNELLNEPNTGITFDPLDSSSLRESISDMIEGYSTFKNNVIKFDINKKDIDQVMAHINLVKND